VAALAAMAFSRSTMASIKGSASAKARFKIAFDKSISEAIEAKTILEEAKLANKAAKVACDGFKEARDAKEAAMHASIVPEPEEGSIEAIAAMDSCGAALYAQDVNGTSIEAWKKELKGTLDAVRSTDVAKTKLDMLV
jgi:hypothetical protein